MFCLMCACAPHVHLVTWRSEGCHILESVIHDYKSPSGCWELNAGPLQELQVFISSELFFSPLKFFFYRDKCAL